MTPAVRDAVTALPEVAPGAMSASQVREVSPPQLPLYSAKPTVFWLALDVEKRLR